VSSVKIRDFSVSHKMTEIMPESISHISPFTNRKICYPCFFNMAAVPHGAAHQCEKKAYKQCVMATLLFEGTDDSVRNANYVYDSNILCPSEG
jgi:hypothetical protein